MSIANEITRLQTAKSNIKTALENKGVTVDSAATLDYYAAYVDNIPSGGGGNTLIKSIEIEDFTGTTFNRCTSYITGVTIPDSVTSIGESAFDGCYSLTSIVCNAPTPPTLGSYAFDGTNDCPIYVPSASVNAYKEASGWSDYASRIQAIP